MAYVAILVCAVLSVFSQVVNSEPQVLAPGYGIGTPINELCPDYTFTPPFRWFCNCNLAICFDLAVAAQLEVIAAAEGLNLCDVHQWAAIVQTTMPSIDYASLTNMVSSISSAFHREMVRQGLSYGAYAPWCDQFYPLNPATPGGPLVNPLLPPTATMAPALVKRSPQVSPAAAYTANPLSPYARTTFYQNAMYFMGNYFPNISPILDAEIQQAIYRNAPLPYLSYADDLDLRLDLNIRSLLSQMYDYNPHYPYGPATVY